MVAPFHPEAALSGWSWESDTVLSTCSGQVTLGGMWPTCHWPAWRLPTSEPIWLLHGKGLVQKGQAQRWEARTQNKVYHLLGWQRTRRRPNYAQKPRTWRGSSVVPEQLTSLGNQSDWGGQEGHEHDPVSQRAWHKVSSHHPAMDLSISLHSFYK